MSTPASELSQILQCFTFLSFLFCFAAVEVTKNSWKIFVALKMIIIQMFFNWYIDQLWSDCSVNCKPIVLRIFCIFWYVQHLSTCPGYQVIRGIHKDMFSDFNKVQMFIKQNKLNRALIFLIKSETEKWVILPNF